MIGLLIGCGLAPEGKRSPYPAPTPPAVPADPPPADPPAPTPGIEVLPQGVLEVNQAREGRLETGQAHDYILPLRAGEAILLVAEQDEVDLEVQILDPDGSAVLSLDSPVGRDAPEQVCLVATASGEYRFRVAAFDRASGSYALRLLHQRAVTPSDRACDEAIRMFTAAWSNLGSGLRSESLATQFQEASLYWQQAGELFWAALALREAGSVWESLNRADRATELFEQARELARRSGNLWLEITIATRHARTLRARGDLGKAQALLRPALEQARSRGDRHGEASTLINLAAIDEITGETHRAIDRYQQAIQIWRERGDRSNLAGTLRNLGNAYALLDHHREALGLLNDALATYRDLDHSGGIANCLFAIGWVHYLRGRAEEGVVAVREALELYRDSGNRAGEAATLDRLGSALRETGDFQAALDAYQESMRLSQDAGNTRGKTATAVNVGCLLQHWGRAEEALETLALAREELAAFEAPKGTAHLEYCVAQAEQQRGDVGSALEHLERALVTVDQLRATASSRGERYLPIWLWQDYQELYLDLLMSQYKATGEERFAKRAFEASDLARARNLFELVLESQVGVRATADASLLEREREVQHRLNTLGRHRRERRATGAAAEEIAGLERRLAELSLELERARAAIRAADPRFSELATPSAVPLSELQRLLEPGTTLLSFALGQQESWVFAVSRTALQSLPLPPRPILEAHADALYRALLQSSLDDLQHRLTGRELAHLLLPAEILSGSARRFLVVADGLLHYVPFAALPHPGSGRHEERMLIDDYEIATLHSASVLATLRQRDADRPSARGPIAIFADPVFSDTDPRSGSSESESAPHGGVTRGSVRVERLPDGPLPRLPFTGEEARRVLQLTQDDGSFAAIGFEATKAAVLSEDLQSYPIVHFATHAFIDEDLPELSGLVFSRYDPRGEAIDGDLHLHEIYGLRLAARLVVASGCQTALGQQVRGDGLLSLTRGFLYAGASQVLVSLWSVDDEATAELMGHFYQALLERGENPTAALRSAQLRMRREARWQAPYYWAGFVLQGDGR